MSPVMWLVIFVILLGVEIATMALTLSLIHILSPRGDWRMPSDASARIWLEDLERITE